jgi:hypothetical protein
MPSGLVRLSPSSFGTRRSGGSWTQIGSDFSDTSGSRIVSAGKIGAGIIGFGAAIDDLSVQSINVTQLSVASATAAAGAWTDQSGGTSLAAAIDETTADDADYIKSELAPVNSGTRLGPLKLRDGTSLGDPISSTGHIIKWRIGKDSSSAPQIDMTVKLYQGGGTTLGAGTLIATYSRTNVDTLTTYQETLTSGEADSITDYSNLYLEFYANQI